MRIATLISLTSLAVASAAFVVVWNDGALDVVKTRLRSVSLDPHRPSKVIYLNREGVTLTAGRDDAPQNRSSLVDGDDPAVIPGFTGSDRTWKAFVKCVEKKVADFDVTVVDQRPVSGEYVMVSVGGRPSDLGVEAGELEHAAGLAPFNGQPIPNAVVLVFAQTLGNATTAMCETAGHEIGHAYGLDHARHCSDLMTYLPRCGARVFLDRNISCGEHSSRDCKTPNGIVEALDEAAAEPKQNSYAHLLRVLGPRV